MACSAFCLSLFLSNFLISAKLEKVPFGGLDLEALKTRRVSVRSSSCRDDLLAVDPSITAEALPAA